MTELWQYIARARRVQDERWGRDRWMYDDPKAHTYLRQWPEPQWFSRLAHFLNALGFLRGYEGAYYETFEWNWRFWEQVDSDLQMGDRGWRHYHLPWSHPIRKQRRRAALRVLFFGR